MSAFWDSSTRRDAGQYLPGFSLPGRGRLASSLLGLCLCMTLCCPHVAEAASHLSAPRSGLEAPGGPRPLDRLPAAGRSSGTMYGNPGYTDAYGNTLDDIPPPEAKPRKRLPPGAYGTYGNARGNKANSRPLPDPHAGPKTPAWSFQ